MLIIDDDENIREIIEMILGLEFNDVEFVQAVDGLDGIEKLKLDTTYDIIICDKNMPKARGVDVYNYNKENTKYPFLLLSGDGVDTDEFDGFSDCENNYCIGKPWQEEEFFDIIRTAIG